MKIRFLGLLVLLVSVFIFASCPIDTDDKKRDEDVGLLNIISIHPTSADYLGGETVQALKVAVMPAVAGTFTFQWFETQTFSNTGGTSISGASSAARESILNITRSADGIEKFYYAVVTNTRNNTTRTQSSNPARVRFLAAAPEAPAVELTVSANNAQYVRGFGGMSNAFWIGGTGARYMQMRDIDTMFHPETGLGYNILRIMLWPVPLDWVISGQIEPQMGNQIYYEIVKKVNEYGGYVLASPWTPPPQWKVNNSEVGTSPSHLLEAHYGDYAQYLANWAKQMGDNGAPIHSLSIQNETTFPATYAGCEWSAAQHLAFWLQVGRFMKDVPGYGGGEATPFVLHMSGEPHQNVTWNDSVRNNPTAHSAIDIYSYHTYGRMDNWYREVQADTATQRREVWMTEKNINSGAGLEAQDYSWDYVWRFADDVDHTIRINDTNAYIWWYLKRYYSMIGDNAYGTLNGEILPRGWVLSHWAKYATDTVRVPTTFSGVAGYGHANDSAGTGVGSTTTNVKASAFRKKSAPVTYWEQQVRNREDSISIVIYDNRTTAGATGQNIRVNLPADFDASQVHAIISDGTVFQAPHLIVLAQDGKTADFFLPANAIVSIKFFK